MGPLEITPQFSLSNARVCLEASEYVYRHDCGIASDLAHAAVLEAGNARVLAFRGSVSARDWITDFQCLRTHLADGVEIHHGFWDAIGSIQSDLVNAAGWGKSPLFLTGHSLGGALAVLAAMALERAGYSVAAVYTFGAPRVGNGAFARSYNERLRKRTFRIVNEEDIVPRVPGWLTGYRHVGQEVFLPSGCAEYVMNPSVWLKALSDAYGTWIDWTRGEVAQLADHGLADYGRRLALVQPEEVAA